ncbi:MAG: hypothetical protein AAF297_05060 [Planctomycetota bacterium]
MLIGGQLEAAIIDGNVFRIGDERSGVRLVRVVPEAVDVTVHGRAIRLTLSR